MSKAVVISFAFGFIFYRNICGAKTFSLGQYYIKSLPTILLGVTDRLLDEVEVMPAGVVLIDLDG
jgi:hypothetical protein